MEFKTLKEMIDYYRVNKLYMTGLGKILYYRDFTDKQKEIYKIVESLESTLEKEQIYVSISDYLSLVKSLVKKEGLSYSLTQNLVDVDERKKDDNLHIYRTYNFVLKVLDKVTNEVKDSRVVLSETTNDEPVPFLQGHNLSFNLIKLLQDKNVLETLNAYPELVDTLVLSLNNKRMAKLELEENEIKTQMQKLQAGLDKITAIKQVIEDENYMLNNKKTLSLINKKIEEFSKPIQDIELTQAGASTVMQDETEENDNTKGI